MPTTFYLRDLTAANPPTAGENSTALPVDVLGANNATGTEETRALDIAIGAAEVSIAKASDSTTAARDNYLCRFTSAGLAAQTIAAATWTIAIALSEGNNAANSFLNLSVYIWRPSTNAVVGFIYDSHTNIGAEWGATEDGQVITFAGAAVTTTLNDVLVLEVWRHAVQAMSVAYTQTVYFNGATAVTDATTTDAGSYLENPNVISFGTQTFTQAVTGGLSFAGTFAKQGNKVMTGGLTFTGGISKSVQTSFSGGLTFAGSVAKQAQRALTGALSFSGVVSGVKLITIAFTAALNFSGSIAKQAAKVATGMLSFTGAITQKLIVQRGRPFLFTAANWGGTVNFFLEVYLRATSGTAEAELYNVTDGATVANSNVSTTSSAFVRLRSAAVTLVDGKEYRLQLAREVAAGGAILSAQIVAA